VCVKNAKRPKHTHHHSATECNPAELRFRLPSRKELVACFDGSDTTSDAGAVLLLAADRRLGLTRRLAACFTDHRAPGRIEHPVEDLLAQRIFGLALGYEDLEDHDALSRDSLLAWVVAERDPSGRSRCRTRDQGRPLASSVTLGRLERSVPEEAPHSRYCRIGFSQERADDLLVDLFLEAHDEAPRAIVLDLDATDVPLHGKQEGRFFHGNVDHNRYLPLLVFC